MFKNTVIIILTLILNIIFSKYTYATNDFETTSYLEYKISESGKTLVTNTISIKNIKSNYFPKSYSLNLNSIFPQNISAYETGRKLNVKVDENNASTNLKIDFNEASVGKDSIKTFVIAYDTESLTRKSGEVWEVTVPKLIDPQIYKDYKIILSIPKLWGDAAYISPEPKDIKDLVDRNLYIFDKESMSNSMITAGFGKYQAFKFALTYHLENTDQKRSIKEIALPPDTSTQIVFYNEITPKPDKLYTDIDGNWIGSYTLSKNQAITVSAKGSVQIIASPKISNNASYIPANYLTSPDNYWQSDDPKIKNIAKYLTNPQEIYNYVVKTLKYNYERVNPVYDRLGALKALEDPNNALCMEFTDLFIALSRASGIPAREINGYAYSQNTMEQPMSLVGDLLHSWPEYWNKDKNVWIPIDPTWENTTGGTDYFNKTDLNHFAFVIHGNNSSKPYSAGSFKFGKEPQKDVFVEIGDLPLNRYPSITTDFKYKTFFPLFSLKIKIIAENIGKSASYGNSLNININGKNNILGENITLLPYSKFETFIHVPYGLLGYKTPNFVTLSVNGKEIIISTEKTKVIINQLLLIFIFFIIGLITYQLRHGKHLPYYKFHILRNKHVNKNFKNIFK